MVANLLLEIFVAQLMSMMQVLKNSKKDVICLIMFLQVKFSSKLKDKVDNVC
jgi:hypothetical protein